MDSGQLILAIAPLAVLSFALLLFCLYDLVNRPANAVLGGNKWVWAAVILFVSTFGPIIYLFLGRREPPMQEG